MDLNAPVQDPECKLQKQFVISDMLDLRTLTSHPLPLLLEKGRNLTMTSHQSGIETSAVVSNKIAWFVAIARGANIYCSSISLDGKTTEAAK